MIVVHDDISLFFILNLIVIRKFKYLVFER